MSDRPYVEQTDTRWVEALRRRAVLEPLAALPRVPVTLIEEAARQLGVSPRWAWIELARFRADPRTSALVRKRGGRPRGVPRLDEAREALLHQVIETFHATRQKPRKRDSYVVKIVAA